MTEPLTPVGLRCRRKALGLSRGDLAAFIGVSEGAIRSWEIGKTQPRDPLSIHVLLGNLEDNALDCVHELTAPADDEAEDVRVIPTALISYIDQAAYAARSLSWLTRTSPSRSSHEPPRRTAHDSRVLGCR